jgi:hypothetical protein
MYHGCAPYPHGHGAHPHHHPHWPQYAILYVPYPVPCPAPAAQAPQPPTVPREVTADDKTGPVTGLIGGTAATGLRLEYWTDSDTKGAAIQVTLESAGQTTTWNEKSAAPGYQTRTPFGQVAPGSKATLEVKGAQARLSWCETNSCC